MNVVDSDVGCAVHLKVQLDADEAFDGDAQFLEIE